MILSRRDYTCPDCDGLVEVVDADNTSIVVMCCDCDGESTLSRGDRSIDQIAVAFMDDYILSEC